MKKVIFVILWAIVGSSVQISFAQSSILYNFNSTETFEKIADRFRQKANDSLALYFYHQSLASATREGDSVRMVHLLSNIGAIYLHLENYTTAMKYQQDAMQRASYTHDTVAVATIYMRQSAIQQAQGHCSDALITANKALMFKKKQMRAEDVAELYFEMYKVYACLSDFKQAYDFQARYVRLNDSLQRAISHHEAARLHFNYELDKKEAAIASIQHQRDGEVFRRNAFIGALVAFLAIGGLLYNRQKIIFDKKLMLKRQRLDNYTQSLVEKSEMIRQVNEELATLRNSLSTEDIHIRKFNEVLNLQILTEDDWESFKIAFEGVHPGFFAKLRYHYPGITVSELRLAALIKLKLSLKESAAMLGISPESVKKSRYRLKKKLEVPDSENVDEFIIRLTA
ncbi:transcriptional regulator [Ohtaekwangia kribbensis]|uniref:Transcriptional regulator n=1 Tax=Ohtaekwangia kribbensis TaxID=688913 RepID=A0ABW3JX89_9BACT